MSAPSASVLPPDPQAPAAQPPSRRRTLLGLLVIMVVSLGLRLGPIDHGLPANYVPDTHLVRSALGMARDKNPVPEVGAYSTYPNLLAYGLLPVYAVQYAGGRATGAWGGAQEFGFHALEHPEDVHLPARILFALLASLLPLVAFGAARAMNLGVGAWVAAWLAATGMLGIHFSIQERPWEPMVLFMLLATWPAARYVATEKRSALVLACLAAALSFGCHQAGGAALLIPAIAWALVFVRNRAELATKAGRLVLDGVLAVAAFVALGVGVGHPYLIVHGRTSTDAVVMGEELEQATGAISLGGQGFQPTFRLESFEHLFAAMLSYDPVLVVLGLLGFFVCWRRRCIWPALAFILAWGGLFLFSANDHVRYILPLVGLLCLPAGALVERLHGRFGAPPVLQGLLAIVLLVPLVQAMRFSHVMGHPDVRALATADLIDGAAALPADARLAVARYAPILPRSLASLDELARVRDLYSRETHRKLRLEGLEEAGLPADHSEHGLPGGAGLDVVYLEDYLDFDDRAETVSLREGVLPELARDDFEGLLDVLGVTHVMLTDKTPGDGQLGLLDGSLGELTLVRAWTPQGRDPVVGLTEGEDPRALGRFEARLPTELDQAGQTIWHVDRPGPVLVLFRRTP